MRNKLLAFILALTMVVGLATMAPIGTVAAGVETLGEDVVVEATGLLMTLNILHGYEDGTLGLDKNVTRAEFAAMLSRMLQGTEEFNLNAGAILHNRLSEAPGSSILNVGSRSYATDINAADYADPHFTDMSELHWAYNDVEFLRGQGIVTGYSDGTFKPDNNILYEEAIKFVVSILGYDFMALGYGGYPDGYIKTANSLKILKNVNGSTGVAATRGQIAVLLFNALNADYLVVDSVESGQNVYNSGKTMLKEIFGIDTEKDVYVTATETTGLYAMSDATEEGYIRLGDNLELKLYDETYNKYLGYNVKAYIKYEEDSDTRGELLYMVPSGKTKSVTFNAKDYESIFYKRGDAILEAYIENDLSEFKLHEDISVIYNDVAYTYAIDVEEIFDIDAGDITLISTEGNSTYDLAFINRYVPMYVEDAKYSEYTIKGKSFYDGEPHDLTFNFDEELEENDDIVLNILYADGSGASIEDIKEDSVIYVKMWNNHYTVQLGGKVVNGKITKKGADYVVIDGETYKEIKGSNILGEYAAGMNIKLALNKDGEIFYTDKNSALGGLDYGVIMDTDIDYDAPFETVYQIKLMDSAGKKGIYKTAEKMKFTDMYGNTYRLGEDFSNAISPAEINAILIESAKKASMQNAKGAGTILGGTSTSIPERKYEQLVKFSLNAAGEISEILLARPSSSVPEGEDKASYFTYEVDADVSGTNFHIDKGIIKNTYFAVDTAKMFLVPRETEYKDSDYSVASVGKGTRNGQYAQVLFDVSETGVVKAFMSFSTSSNTGSYSGDHNRILHVIEYFRNNEAVEFEGEIHEAYTIGYIADGKYDEKYSLVRNDEVTSYGYGYLQNDEGYNVGDVMNPDFWSANGYWKEARTSTEFDKTIGTLGSGDIQFYNGYYPIKSVINRIVRDDPDMYLRLIYQENTYGTPYREYVFGKVRYVEDGRVVVEYGDEKLEAVSCNISGKKATRYDGETGYVALVDAKEVEKGDWVLLQMNEREFKSMVIYKDVTIDTLDLVQREKNERD